MKSGTGKAARGRTHGDDLFPPTWPWRAWPTFADAVLAAVYARSADLWHDLRKECGQITSWVQHLEYEGDISAGDTFYSAAKVIPAWPAAAARLEQARNLLGRSAWDSLVRQASTGSE